MMLTNKTLFENIYKFDDCHIRICVHYDESQSLLNLLHVADRAEKPQRMPMADDNLNFATQ